MDVNRAREMRNNLKLHMAIIGERKPGGSYYWARVRRITRARTNGHRLGTCNSNNRKNYQWEESTRKNRHGRIHVTKMQTRQGADKRFPMARKFQPRRCFASSLTRAISIALLRKGLSLAIGTSQTLQLTKK